MTNDPNWTKTKIYYLVIGHACDEESAWLYLDFEEEKTNDFLEKKLCPAGKAAAKRKFKVYPSAYANGWAVQYCRGKFRGKKKGGKKK